MHHTVIAALDGCATCHTTDDAGLRAIDADVSGGVSLGGNRTFEKYTGLQRPGIVLPIPSC